MIKKTIQNIFNFFGYKISKTNTIDSTDLDKITTLLIDVKEPIIFDVGGNVVNQLKDIKNYFLNVKFIVLIPINTNLIN